jgi:hypothetical protein
MNKFILFVGNTDDALSNQAKRYNLSAKLIEKRDLINLDQILVGYISVGDHEIKDFIHVLDMASEIHYVPTDTWSNVQIKQQTELWLHYFSRQKKVYNLTKVDVGSILSLSDQRKTDNKQLWAVGCSFTNGDGIGRDQTYGYIIGQELKLPVSFLSEGGSSIPWAADQILRSDIKKDDIVIWGVTGAERYVYYDQDKIKHISLKYYDSFPSFNRVIDRKLLVSDHMLYSAITAIEQIINYSNKIGFKLVLTLFPLNIISHDLFMRYYLSQFDFVVNTYIEGEEKFIDCGSDNLHPGPKQHQYYANLILEYLKNENIS